MSLCGCPGQIYQKISVVRVRNPPFPRPLGGNSAYVAAAEKVQTLRYQISGVFAPQEVILGVLSIYQHTSFAWYSLFWMKFPYKKFDFAANPAYYTRAQAP